MVSIDTVKELIAQFINLVNFVLSKPVGILVIVLTVYGAALTIHVGNREVYWSNRCDKIHDRCDSTTRAQYLDHQNDLRHVYYDMKTRYDSQEVKVQRLEHLIKTYVK